MNQTTSQPLLRDCSCIGCAYNLRGLAVSANCPECGSPVNRSIHGDSLWHSDSRWLRMLRWGTLLLFSMSLVNLGWHWALHFGDLDYSEIEYLYVSGMLIFSGVNLVAVWLLTMGEPRAAAESTRVSLRGFTRCLLIASVLGGMTAGMISLSKMSYELSIFFHSVASLTYMGGAVGEVLFLVMLSRYARRMNSRALAKWTRITCVVSILANVPYAFAKIYFAVSYVWEFYPSVWAYEWSYELRKYGVFANGAVFIPLILIYYHKFENARRFALRPELTDDIL